MKYRSKWTEEKIERLRKEGRGEGDLEDYKPWINIHDVPSIGYSTKIKGWKTKRLHHFLSDLELNVFYVLEWSQNVIDIKEQFPLARDSTMKIANELGIKHPIYPGTDLNVVMTTDFFIIIQEGDKLKTYARTVKMSDDLEKSNVIEKFEIERMYWQNRGVDWGIITEKEMNKILIRNMDWLHSFYELPENLFLINRRLGEEMQLFLGESEEDYLSLIKEFSRVMGAELSDLISLFKHLVATRRIKIDLFNKFILDEI